MRRRIATTAAALGLLGAAALGLAGTAQAAPAPAAGPAPAVTVVTAIECLYGGGNLLADPGICTGGTYNGDPIVI